MKLVTCYLFSGLASWLATVLTSPCFHATLETENEPDKKQLAVNEERVGVPETSKLTSKLTSELTIQLTIQF